MNPLYEAIDEHNRRIDDEMEDLGIDGDPDEYEFHRTLDCLEALARGFEIEEY